MDEPFSLKDALFNTTKVTQIAQEITRVYPTFAQQSFVESTITRFPELELKQRITWISEQLRTFLPKDYRTACTILLKSLPEPNDHTKTDNDFGDFIYTPYAEFVARYGCTKENLTFSLEALKEITMRVSAEDAIRYFINAYPTETMKTLMEWSTDSNYHVRRLASEGTRPKLPWSQKITLDPKEALPILDNLYPDKTRYVVRSVANHLNDISKIDPEHALRTLHRWQQAGKQNEKEMTYLITHGLRTLIKKGDPRAMTFLQLSPDPQIMLSDFVIKKDQLSIGETLKFHFSLMAQKDEEIIIDYLMSFQNKAGHMASKKVYKIKRLQLKKGEKIMIEKRHPLKVMTTRKLYPGEHKIEIQINGKKMGERVFEVLG